jgi:hypothetical protein
MTYLEGAWSKDYSDVPIWNRVSEYIFLSNPKKNNKPSIGGEQEEQETHRRLGWERQNRALQRMGRGGKGSRAVAGSFSKCGAERELLSGPVLDESGMVELLTRKQVKRYSRKWRRAHKLIVRICGRRKCYYVQNTDR